MRLNPVCLSLLLSAFASFGAEKIFDLAPLKEGATPPGWRPALTGGGGPVKWVIVEDEVPSAIERFTDLAPAVNRRPVVAQLSNERTDERFPLLIYDEEEFGDFTLTTRFKTVAGDAEQMAGIAFRIVDERNYHVIRASSKGNTLYFYSFINGERTPPVGVNLSIPTNTWHTLEIAAEATRFRFKLNGQDAIPPLENPNFRRGKIGYWTKSDSISYFVDTRISYKPREIQAQRLVKSALEKFDRLVGLQVVLPGTEPGSTRVLASSDPAIIDQPGIPEERIVLDKGEMMYLARKNDVTVTLPLRDRNGEIIAAVRVTMKRFTGQTQKNAIARAQPVVVHFQSSVMNQEDLYE